MCTKTETKETECLVSGALSTSFRLCQILGVAPIQMKRTQHGHIVKVSRKLYAMQCFVIGIISISTIIIMSLKIRALEHAMWQCIWNIIMIGSINAVYGAQTRVGAIIEALASIQKINNSIGFEKQGSTESKKSVAIVMSTIYFFVMAIINPRSTSQSENIWKPLFYLLHGYQYIVLLTVNIKFTLCAFEVAATLCSFNDLLDYISTTNLQGLEAAYKMKRSTKTLEETFQNMATNYGKLCEVVKLLDVGNGRDLIITLLTTFLSLIYAPSLFIQHYIRNEPPLWNAIWIMQWSLMHLFWLLSIIQPCHKIQHESERANLTTSKLLVICEDEVCLTQLDKLSKNFILTNVLFSPCGICTLSQKLFSTIIVSVAMYLIIVIQFSA